MEEQREFVAEQSYVGNVFKLQHLKEKRILKGDDLAVIEGV